MRGHKFKKISAGDTCSAAIDEDGYLYCWGYNLEYKEFSSLLPCKIDNELHKDVDVGNNIFSVHQTNNNILNSLDYTYIETVNSLAYNNSSFSLVYERANLKSHNIFQIDKRSISVPILTSHKTYINVGPFDAYFPRTIEKTILSFDDLIISYVGVSDFFYYFDTPGMYVTDDIYIANSFSYYGFVVLADGKVTNINGKACYNSDYKPLTFFEDVELSSLNDIIKCSVNKTRTNGRNTAYFLDKSGNIYSLGYNDNCSLLGANITDSVVTNVPLKVESPCSFINISAGKQHVLALDENGKVYTWGNNAYGQLGHNDTTIRTIPTMIKTFDETKSFNFNAFSNEVFNDSFYQYGGSEYSVIEDGS